MQKKDTIYVVLLKYMAKKILISGSLSSYKTVVLSDNDRVEDVSFGGAYSKSIKSNIYLATVLKIEPSLQAAFVDYGTEKAGFLPFSEIHPDYYNNQQNVTDIIKFESQNGVTIPSNEDGETETVTDMDKIEFHLETQEDEIDEDRRGQSDAKERSNVLIQNVISVGQQLLVQVFRDERGNKGASMTSYITLPTKFCVFTPNNRRLHGVSRRIPDFSERKRLRDIISKFDINKSAGLVVRTAACGVNEKDLNDDYIAVLKHWNSIVSKVKNNINGLIEAAESGVIQSIMSFGISGTKIIVDNNEVCDEITKLSHRIGIEKNSVIVHRDKQPLFERFNVTPQINDLYKERVELKSGGYLIINHTEALVAIDVNSGRLVREKDIEHTALKTNLDATDEICRQIRLRDIGGLIIVDFIDMTDQKNRRIIEERMKNILSLHDRARVQFTAISPFGLMEISRQRLRTSFIDSTTTKCNHCYGTGRVFTVDAVLDEVLSSLKYLLSGKNYENVEVYVSEVVFARYDGYNKQDVTELQNKYNTKIYIISNPDMKYDNFRVLGNVKGEGLIEVMKFAGLKMDDNNGGVNGWYGNNNRQQRLQNDTAKYCSPGIISKVCGHLKKLVKFKKNDNEKKPENRKPYRPRNGYQDRRHSNRHYGNRRKS